MELDGNQLLAKTGYFQVIGAGYLALRPSPEERRRALRTIQGTAYFPNHSKFICAFSSGEIGCFGGSGLRQSGSCGRFNLASTACATL